MSQYDDPETIESLKAEIARLRHALGARQKRKAGIANLKRIVTAAMIAGSIGGALWLVLAQKARESLVRQVVKDDLVAQASTITTRDSSQQQAAPSATEAEGSIRRGARNIELFRSPRSDTTNFESSRHVPAAAAEVPRREGRKKDEQKTPRQEVAPESGAPPQPQPKLVRPKSESEPAQNPPRSAPVSQASGSAAYNLVLSNRPKMKQLVSQGSSRWSVVKEDNGLIWIDIVVARDGEEHYIWAVDLQKKTVEALSQAARNLEG
ncbi:MAG TPA: hypothetical protein VGL91_00205 [Acidobacteriota bacterium]|jgi:pimeloyl-ACP methyl ester carboxylesterase